MLLTDLAQVKAELGIDPAQTGRDKLLNFFIETASSWIQDTGLLGGRPLELKSRSEYYNGTGTQKILLRARPVFQSPLPRVFVDQGGNYGATSGAFTQQDSELTYGSTFGIVWDREDGTQSKSGILYRINAYWPKPNVRQWGLLSPFIGDSFGNVKVIYTGGYTVDTLPAVIREAANFIVAQLDYLWPLGVQLASESYEERSISLVNFRKERILAQARSILSSFRNWNFA